jgi:tagatose 1,6-diphosphate aldolase
MAEFSKPRYGIDVLKVETPVLMKHVRGAQAFTGDAAYDRNEALTLFKKQGTATKLPFIYLSAGVPISEFAEALD